MLGGEHYSYFYLLRAERKAGKLLAETEKAKASQGNQYTVDKGQHEPGPFKQAKQSAGISDTQAKRKRSEATKGRPRNNNGTLTSSCSRVTTTGSQPKTRNTRADGAIR